MRLSYVGLDGSKNDHLTNLSLARRGGSRGSSMRSILLQRYVHRALIAPCVLRITTWAGLGDRVGVRSGHKLQSRNLGHAAFRISSSTSAKLTLVANMMLRTADATRLALDSANPAAINSAESIDVSPSQKIRTHRTCVRRAGSCRCHDMRDPYPPITRCESLRTRSDSAAPGGHHRTKTYPAG